LAEIQNRRSVRVFHSKTYRINDVFVHNSQMPEILKFANYEVAVIRSKRRKSAAIKVDLDGVSVRVPENLPLSDIRSLVAEKSHWVETKLKTAAQKRQAVEGRCQAERTAGSG
jgi:predicted metal-dependent hydrolase